VIEENKNTKLLRILMEEYMSYSPIMLPA
jgi:hypothetical protein